MFFKKTEKKDINLELNKKIDNSDDYNEIDPFADVVSGSEKNTRKAMSKALADSIYNKVEKTVSLENIGEVVRRSLPEEYSQLYNAYNGTIDNTKKIYESAVKEARPLVRTIKKTVGKLQPTVDSILPKSMAEKFKEWAKEDFDYGSYSKSLSEERNDNLKSELSEFLKFQIRNDLNERVEDNSKETIKNTIENMRHKDVIGNLIEINKATAGANNFNEALTAKYYHKQLSIGIKQIYLLTDILEANRKLNAMSAVSFDAIKMNTSLPEYKKLELTERLGERTRNKFVDAVGGKINRTLFDEKEGVFGDFVANLNKNITEAISSKVATYKNMIAQPLEMVSGMTSGENGMSAGEIGATLAGDEISGRVKKKVENIVIDKLTAFVKEHKEVEMFANKISYGVNNAGPLLKQKVDEATTKNYGFLNPFIRLVSDSFGDGRYDNKLNQLKFNSTTDDLNKPITGFTERFSRSVTDVIPGLLSRMFRELKIIRTGNPDTDLVEYNFLASKFTDSVEIKNDIFNQIFNRNQSEKLKTDGDSILKNIDPNGTMLTNDQRDELIKFLLNEKINGTFISKDFLTNEASYRNKVKDPKSTASIFTKLFDDDVMGYKLNGFDKDLKGFGKSVDDKRAFLQSIVNSGYGDVLKEIGLVSKDGYIDVKKLYEMVLNGTTSDGLTNTYSDQATISKKARTDLKTVGNSGIKEVSKNNGTSLDVALSVKRTSEEADPVLIRDINSDVYENKLNRLIDSNTGILEYIKTDPYKTNLDSVVEYLKHILEIVFYNTDIAKRNNEEGDGEVKKKRWYNKSLLETGSSIVGAGFSVLKFAKNSAKNSINRAFNTAKFGFTTAQKVGSYSINKAKEISEKIKDVRMKGNPTFVMSNKKLKDGHYMDESSGKIITDFKEITGNVKDITTNEIVLEATDINKLYYVGVGGKVFKLVLGLAGGIKNLVKSTYYNQYRLASRISSMALSFGKSAISKTYVFLLDSPCDIYIRKKETPSILTKVILKKKMENGGYFSALTKKPITRPSMIDGTIIDEIGKEVVTMDDVLAGLYDENGKVIKTGFKKLMGAVGATTRFIGKGIQKAYGFGRETVNGVLDFGKGLIGKTFGLNGFIQVNGKKTIDILTKIFNVLDSRLPGKKVRNISDRDGDGVRDGSWEDQKKKYRSRNDDKKEKILNYVKSKGKDNKSEAPKEEEKSSGGGIFGTLLAMAAPWIMTRIMPWVASRAAAAAVTTGTAALTTTAASAVTTGAVVGAETAAVGTGIAGAEAVAVGGGMMAGGGLAAAATGIGLGTVLLGGAVLGGLAYGGYKAYKWLSKTKMTSLNKLRCIQYGIDPDDEEKVNVVFSLEELLNDKVKVNSKDNKPSLDLSKISFGKLVHGFNVSEKDPSRVRKWTKWFMERFKPVFLNSFAAKTIASIEDKLTSIDNLSPAKKLEYFKYASFRDGPYTELSNPFDIKDLTIDKKFVIGWIDNIQAILESKTTVDQRVKVEEITKDKKNPYQNNASSVVKGDVKKDIENKDSNSVAKESKVDKLGDSGNKNNKITSITSNNDEVIDTTDKLDPITSIRMKTYGLVDLNLEKVKALLKLEYAVLKQVTFRNAIATWRGSTSDILFENGSYFGLVGMRNNRADEWIYWFNSRFVPTFISFLSALAKNTSSIGTSLAVSNNVLSVMMRGLDTEKMINIAFATYSAKFGVISDKHGSGASVWTVTQSPWDNYILNKNIKSIDGNMEYIRKSGKSVNVSESTTKESVTAEKKTATESNSNVNSVNNPNSPNKQSPVNNSNPGFFGGLINGTKNFFNGVVETVSKTVDAGAYKLGIIEHPGHGTGGDINSLPVPLGKNNYASYKDLIDKASAMAGVDPKVMAIMAAIESSFDNSAKPGNTSAKGLYQFTKKTWESYLKKSGHLYGLGPDTSVYDVRANTLMGAELLKDNYKDISKIVKRPLTAADLYAGHMLGLPQVTKFYKAADTDIAASVIPDAAASNLPIFYKDGVKRQQPRTIGEVKALYAKKIVTAAKDFKIDSNYSVGTIATPTAGTPNNAPTTAAAPTAPVDVTSKSPVDVGANKPKTPMGAVAQGGGVAITSTPLPTLEPNSNNPTAPTKANAEKIASKKTTDNTGTSSSIPTPKTNKIVSIAPSPLVPSRSEAESRKVPNVPPSGIETKVTPDGKQILSTSYDVPLPHRLGLTVNKEAPMASRPTENSKAFDSYFDNSGQLSKQQILLLTTQNDEMRKQTELLNMIANNLSGKGVSPETTRAPRTRDLGNSTKDLPLPLVPVNRSY